MQNSDYKFNPRGIIKWHAFAALISGEEQKNQVIIPDQLENNLLDNAQTLLDYNLDYAFKNNIPIAVEYIENNTLKYIEGLVKEIDYINKDIIIDELRLNVKTIINLSTLD